MEQAGKLTLARLVLIIGLVACLASLAVAYGGAQQDVGTAERIVRVETKVETLERQYNRLETLAVGIVIGVATNLITSVLSLRNKR